MLLKDFAQVLIDGINNYPKHLKSYLIRELKKAHALGITNNEFAGSFKLVYFQIVKSVINECPLFEEGDFFDKDKNLNYSVSDIDVKSFSVNGHHFDLAVPILINQFIEVIQTIENIIGNELESEMINEKSSFRLTNKKGAKVDLIRILNAMYELQMVKLPNEQIPPKKLFMEKAGQFFGIDLAKYDADLAQALDGSKEKNIRIFEEMKVKTLEKIDNKLWSNNRT